MSQRRNLFKDTREVKTSRFRSWKAGKRWLYAASALTILSGAGIMISAHSPILTLHAQAATALPSDFNQIGNIGSAPLYQTPNTAWSNIQKGVDALAKNVQADYYVGAVSKTGQGQSIGWWDGQTSYAGTALGSLTTANPSDLSQPNYNFVHKAMMSSADGFTDADNFNYINSPGQYAGIHNVGQAYEKSTGKYIPIGLKVTINDATYYDGVNAAPRDVFTDGYKLMVAARNDGAGNITLGYVVVMTGVPAVDNGGGGEGGGGSGSGQTYGGATTGVPESVFVSVTYVNEETGQILPNNSLSVMKVADVDASQRAEVGQDALGYVISNPTNLSVDNNALTANNNTVVSSPGLSANSFVTIKTSNNFGLRYTDTFGNQNQGSIIMALFGKNAVSLPAPDHLVKNVLTKSQANNSYPSGLSQAGAQFKLKNKNSGNFVKASDALSNDQAIKATNGSLSTASDGSLLWTTGSDGKVGAMNLPAIDDSGKPITYEWTEVKAPKGEAIQAPDGNQDFAGDPNGTPDSDNNLPTPATTIKDQPLVETGIAKVNADSNGAVTNGMPDLSGAEFTLKDAKGNVMKQSQGLDPKTGKQANVTLSSGSAYAPDANGDIVLVTNSQGVAGIVSNLDLPSADGLQWVETKAPNGFAINDTPVTVAFTSDNAIDSSNNNVEDDKANSATIADKPMLEATLDKDSTNAEFNHKLGDAVYELQKEDGTPVKENQGLDPKTGDAANIVVTQGTFVDNPDGNVQVKLTDDGLADVKNIDGTMITNHIQWVEIDPATGHALNQEAATGSFDKGKLSDDQTNFIATSKTTDKPLGETEIAKLDADTGDNTTQGAGTLEGAEFTLVDTATQTPIKQSQGVDPKTGLQANVVLRAGSTYASSANGNIVLVTNEQGIAGGIQNLDLSDNLSYQWIETKAPYGYTINNKPIDVNFANTNKVDTDTNNYEDDKNLEATISDRIVDFNFNFLKAATDNGATFLNGAEFTLTPLDGTKNSLGQFDNGKDTNINGQDTTIDPDTGLATPVTSVDQLYLGAVQTSHDWTDPQGSTSAGRVEYNHVQAGRYTLKETKTPDGYDPVHDMTVEILPETTTNGAPSEYEFKVTDTVTGNVLRDVKIPVSYSTTEDGRQLINNNNSLGNFNLGSLFDSPTPPPVPSIDVEKANDTMPNAGNGNDTDKDNNAGENDHDTADTALVIKEGAITSINFLITNNGKDDLEQLKPVDKTINGSVDLKTITWKYKDETLTLNKDGVLTHADDSNFILPVGENIQGTAELPALPEGELHTDQIDVDAVGVKSKTPVHDRDEWNGVVPKPSIDIEKANGAIPEAGNGNHTDKANNVGANDHDTPDTAFVVKDKATTGIYFKGTNNGTEVLSHIKVGDTTTEGSVTIQNLIWSYKGQILELNDAGELVTQNGQLLILAPNEFITATSLLPALPVGELHGDQVSISGVGVLDNKLVSDDDDWFAKVTAAPSIDVEKTDGGTYETGKGNGGDKDNNVKNDHDTLATAAILKVNQSTEIDFNFTNTGNETLMDLKPVDRTIEGKIDVTKITYSYQGKPLTLDEEGYFMLEGKRLELPAGESIRGKGILEGLSAGAVHGDEVSITGVGKFSKTPVSDKDKYYAKTPAPTTPPASHPSSSTPFVKKVEELYLPTTGDKSSAIVMWVGTAVLLATISITGVRAYRRKKEKLESLDLD